MTLTAATMSDTEFHTAELDAIERISDELHPDYLERYQVVPVRRDDKLLIVGTWSARDQIDPQVVDDLLIASECKELRLVRVPEAQARQAMRRTYASDATVRGVLAGLEGGSTTSQASRGLALDDLVSLANEAPVVKLVNLLIVEALAARASDVHLESGSAGVRARYRVDGVLVDAPAPPPHLAAALISRLKIMSELNIAERRLPQDGRMQVWLQDRQVDVRVSVVPALQGESVVLRLLDKDRGPVSLVSVGMPDAVRHAFEDVVRRPNGIVLVTGPTGSGKTTTLYAAVELLRTGREKMMTVEDPVEYELKGVVQVPVNERIGLTFASALRSLLRQDPDVLMVGEIRDAETAEIAIQASLTGHLVLSTLHTNDAASALTRLADLGVAPFLTASTVQAVLAQRLVRRVCVACGGTGCTRCVSTGFRGRVGIFELLLVDDAIRDSIQKRAGAHEITAIARQRGMRTLAECGDELVAAGITTLAEVARVTRE